MNTAITEVIEAITNDILTISHSILNVDKVGINKKTNKNTLKDSTLNNDVEVIVKSLDQSIVIEALFANYIQYIEKGRAQKSGKQPPIDALRDWALQRGIPTDNSTLFLISRAIWRDGYEARPILATLEQEINERFENEWSDLLFDSITTGLTKYFD